MKITRYYSYLVLLILLLPYGWGVPTYFLLLVPVSVGAFFLSRWALFKFENARATSQAQTMIYFVAAAATMLGHTALVGAFSAK